MTTKGFQNMNAFMVMLRCASDDIPMFLFDRQQVADEVAAAITPAKAFYAIKAMGWECLSDPIEVVVVTFRDGIVVGQTGVIDCIGQGWKRPSDTADDLPTETMPPFIQWMQENGIGRAQHLGGKSWSVRSAS
jgi:hypothetical protein